MQIQAFFIFRKLENFEFLTQKNRDASRNSEDNNNNNNNVFKNVLDVSEVQPL